MTLRLHDASGHGLTLRVAHYEHPDRTGPLDHHDGYDDDANWLVVDGEVVDGGRRWAFRAPCLTTSEAGALAHWLREAAAGRAPARLGFVEPCLGLRIGRQAGGSVHLTATFASRALPPGEEAPRAVALVVPSAHLRRAAEAWSEHLLAYPER
ncbi:hypothetical protein RDV89_18695 [Nocardioides zeae]|uniref:Uncharacterized protein n=1 Tax=Nocardioides imazamoxiresistens TaxID=3231893 RepID=A0ABU3Q0U4_9ACTN|nr:hypothetical protein [Nocardioides zeae]MDT9595123.1 hypothetical protein [Nocardioides zeae]